MVGRATEPMRNKSMGDSSQESSSFVARANISYDHFCSVQECSVLSWPIDVLGFLACGRGPYD